MPKTYMDAEGWTAAESWRTIRTVRAQPPARFVRQLSGARKQVFHTALEQSQQQFAAAASIGYDSRPLNLFYGLSQAGRALAAASPHLLADTWKSSSHGLSMPQPSEKSFWNNRLKVTPSFDDTFSRLCVSVGGTPPAGSIELGALASQIPLFSNEFRKFRSWPGPFCVSFDAIQPVSGEEYAILTVREYDGKPDENAARRWAATYPILRAARFREVAQDGAALFEVPLDLVELPIHSYGQASLKAASEIGLRGYALPASPSLPEALHPIANWWLLLFGFSMIARYHPREWSSSLDIRSNPAATEIEYLLDLAVSAVPEAIARHLWDSPWSVRIVDQPD